jgi:formamidopyrimidine-DNA glycosylase
LSVRRSDRTGRSAHFESTALGEPHIEARAHRPALVQRIGNAYSDESLHAARLSPVKLSRSLSEPEIARLHRQTEAVLTLGPNLPSIASDR